jgi:hypothetical protein
MDDPANYDQGDLIDAGVTSMLCLDGPNPDYHVEDEIVFTGFKLCHPDFEYIFSAVGQAQISPILEPMSYLEAMKSPDAKEWNAAMQDEMNSLKALNVWELVTQPPGTNLLKGRWVYKNKLGDQNQLVRRKARFVVKGFLQVYGRDFLETHAPVAKMKSILMLLSLTASYDYELHQLDFDTAFLNAPVKETIYMEQPEGFRVGGNHIVLRLIKALYGLKQAPHEWNETINSFMEELGWKPTLSDSCVYVKCATSGRLMFLCLYVDDTIVSFHVGDKVEWFKDKDAIAKKFAIKDLGECNWILNMKVTRNRSTRRIHLSQQAYVEKMCAAFLPGESIKSPKPILGDATSPPKDEPAEPLTGDRFDLYRQIVGSLLYAANVTRIDISHAVAQLCRFSANSNEYHLKVALNVLAYLKRNNELGLEFGRSATSNQVPILSIYTDASWGSDHTDRKSTTGVIVTFNGDMIKWVSKKQKCVALSSLESEYIALAEGVKEAKWCQSWIKEVLDHEVKAEMLCDNQAAIAISKADSIHDRSKHIDLRYHFIRDEMKKKNINLRWITTKVQLADILTKCLDKGIHGNLRGLLMRKPWH